MKQDEARPSLAEQDDETASLIERAAQKLSQARPASEAGSSQDAKATSVRSGQPGGRDVSQCLEVDLDRLAAAGYLTPQGMRSRLAEEMRLIKRSVVQTFWYQEVDNANLIMATSAFPGEGKSFTSLNLAISLACEVDFHVLLVDADFERPVIFDRLGISPHEGLMEVLKNPDRDLSEVMYRTNIGHLSLIGPGRPDALSSELLGSQRMQSLTKEMAQRYPDRLILFDSPPLLSSSEPAVLAEHMGQVLFVVEADVTRREMIESALERLPPNCATGMVLNKGRSWRGSNQYPYYGYRNYRGQDEDDQS